MNMREARVSMNMRAVANGDTMIFAKANKI